MAPTTTERPALPANLRRASLWTLGMLGLTALAFAVGLPASLAVLITGPAAISFAIAALFYTRGVPSTGGIQIWLWVAVAIGGLSLFAGMGLVLMRGPLEDLEACYARAITPEAKRECEAEYEKAYENLLERYGSVTTP